VSPESTGPFDATAPTSPTSPTSPAAPEVPDGPPPAARLVDLSLAYLQSAALSVAAKVGVADQLAQGPRTAAELAAHAGVDADRLSRVLRLLASMEIFREDATGRFHLTPMAEPLRSDVPFSMHGLVSMFTHDLFWVPTGRLTDTVAKGDTIFGDLFGAPFFAHLATDPEAARLFDTGMAGYSESENGPVIEALLSADALPAGGTVVDLGGGRGGFLRRLLAARPDLDGVLFDRPDMLAGHLLDVPELAGRWRTEAGDFFTAVPQGADVYVIKRVVHDWTDEECVRILTLCREAMAPGGRVVIVESVLPEPNVPHFARTLDVLMMSLLNGRERDRDDFEKICTASGLRIAGVTPTSTPVSVIEAVPT
jgi:hypothetical protein